MRLLHTLKRFWRYLIALLTCRLDRFDDPKTLLLLAQREMQEMHANNRERAVQVITQRNRLRQVIADTRKRADCLLAEANEAARRGEREQADALFHDWEKAIADLAHTEQSLAHLERTVEDVKASIRHQEQERARRAQERINERLNELRALKAQLCSQEQQWHPVFEADKALLRAATWFLFLLALLSFACLVLRLHAG